ncbi:MAG: DMT family transporter [Armatimonadetes bacterium]|nr:DMT family transporter [Armatimonadota bacterium]
MDAASLSALLFLGLGCSAFCYTLCAAVLSRADVSEVTLTIYLQPVFGVLIGLFLLNEPLYWRTFIGGAVIFASVTLALSECLPGKALEPERMEALVGK